MLQRFLCTQCRSTDWWVLGAFWLPSSRQDLAASRARARLFWQYALSAVSVTGLIALFINEVLP